MGSDGVIFMNEDEVEWNETLKPQLCAKTSSFQVGGIYLKAIWDLTKKAHIPSLSLKVREPNNFVYAELESPRNTWNYLLLRQPMIMVNRGGKKRA